MPSNQRSNEYKESFVRTLTGYFREEVFAHVNTERILLSWTFNLDLDDSAFFLRVSNFVSSLLRTEEMD
jgi:hypothetical protein